MRELQAMATVRGKAVVVGLAAVLTLASSAVAQESAGQSDGEGPTLTAPISVLLAGQLGNDAEAIFRFVADEVRYEPYSGQLRGAAGTYFERAGNSVDQSLLLARVLGAIDVRTRLAVGALDEAASASLLEAAALDAEALDRQRTMAWSGQLPGFADAPAVPSLAEYLPHYDGATQSQAVDAWAVEQVTGTLERIVSTLAEAGVRLPDGFAAMPADEVELHTWVQASIDGEWVDLDPSLPGIAFGEALAEAAETLDAIPDERRHSVEIRIVGETLADGALVEDELLRVNRYADEIAGQPIVIAHVGPDADPAFAQKFEAALGLTSLHPVIAVGDAAYGGSDVRFGDPAALEDGGLGGGFFDASSLIEETTAEWIDLTVRSPGRQPVTIRRTLFDRVPAELRSSGAVTPDALAPPASVDVDGDGTLELEPELAVAWLTVATGRPSPLSGVLDLADDDERLLAIVPWTRHMLDELAGSVLARELGVSTFVDAPNVTAVTAQVRADASGGPAVETAIDIWHRSRGVLPVPGTPAVEIPAAVPGILAYVSERLVDGEALEAVVPHAASGVAEVFDGAAAQGIGLAAVVAPADVDQLPYPPAALSTLRRSIDAGWVAVVPRQPVEVGGEERLGWWLVDPASGRAADQMDDGRAAELPEFTPLEVLILQIIGAVATAKIAYELAKLYYDPPRMQGPGEGFRAVQEFFGW